MRIISVLLGIFLITTLKAWGLAPCDINPGSDLNNAVWQESDSVVTSEEMLACFRAYPIDDATFARMQGRSFRSGCPVKRSELRYLLLPHYDGYGFVRMGEMVCNASIAATLIKIFRNLYKQRYPIERMVLIDDYNADDVASMRANNTSCFNFRHVAGSKKLSAHSLGLAVDINPLYNPYVKVRKSRTMVSPEEGRPYIDRSRSDIPMKIDRNDAACRAFKANGFIWGGDWKSIKDYQHFEVRRR